MNPKIEQLAIKAGMVEYPTGLGIQENTIWGDRNIEKFAQLILQNLTLHDIQPETAQQDEHLS